MTDEELAKRLGTAASIGWNEPEPYRTELTTLASARLRHLSAVERAAREMLTTRDAMHPRLSARAWNDAVGSHDVAVAALRSALEGGK
jgi:hypothetical protein